MSGFIVDSIGADDLIVGAEEDKSSEEDFDPFDTVCAFCDNGGELICCEGCTRSFHPTKEAGEESCCESLGFTQKKVDAIEKFLCKNCEYKQHQCFACGKLGSSDKSSGTEVFQCVTANCGKFYHSHCVAKLLHHGDEVAEKEHAQKIVAGEMFTCPIHRCCTCKKEENKAVPEQQFAVCRRCPKSYHRKCLPREFVFEDKIEEGIITRAWDGLLPCRILIFCLEHEMIEELGTPARDHIKFPIFEDKEITVKEKKKRKVSDLFMRMDNGLAFEDSLCETFVVKKVEQLSSIVKKDQTTGKSIGCNNDAFVPRDDHMKNLESRKVESGSPRKGSFLNNDNVKNQSDETCRKRRYVEENGGRGKDQKSPANAESGKKVPITSSHSPSNLMDGMPSKEKTHSAVGENGYERGYQESYFHIPKLSQPGCLVDSLGFAPRAHPLCRHHQSAGWIDE